MSLGSTKPENASKQYRVGECLWAVVESEYASGQYGEEVFLWAVQSRGMPLGSTESEYASGQYGVRVCL
jgi:hypothetical protein